MAIPVPDFLLFFLTPSALHASFFPYPGIGPMTYLDRDPTCTVDTVDQGPSLQPGLLYQYGAHLSYSSRDTEVRSLQIADRREDLTCTFFGGKKMY